MPMRIIAICCVAMLAACASRTGPVYKESEAGTAWRAEEGVVASVREVTIEGDVYAISCGAADSDDDGAPDDVDNCPFVANMIQDPVLFPATVTAHASGIGPTISAAGGRSGIRRSSP